MRLCIVTTAFPRWRGDGQGIWVLEAARRLAQRGMRVLVIAMHSPGALRHEFIDGVEVVRPRYCVPERWELLRRAGAGGLPATWRRYPLLRLLVLPFALSHTAAILRRIREYDLVHAHWTLSAALALPAVWLYRRPLVVTIHGSDILQVPRRWWGRLLTCAVLRRCSVITPVSQALGRAASALGVPESRTLVIPDGVDTTFFHPSSQRENLILFVGSLIPRKGVRYLLEAMPMIVDRAPQCRLLVAGDGPDFDSLRQQASDLGIRDRVCFTGFLSQDQVRDWMQRARVLVVPSLEEGLGVVALEAMACGTPVVASRVDGLQEIASDSTGVLVPPADPAALARATTCLLCDDAAWHARSQAARSLAESHYDWSHVIDRFVELYHSLAAQEH